MLKYGMFLEDPDTENGWTVDILTERQGRCRDPWAWSPVCERCTKENATIIVRLLNTDYAKKK